MAAKQKTARVFVPSFVTTVLQNWVWQQFANCTLTDHKLILLDLYIFQCVLYNVFIFTYAALFSWIICHLSFHWYRFMLLLYHPQLLAF